MGQPCHLPLRFLGVPLAASGGQREVLSWDGPCFVVKSYKFASKLAVFFPMASTTPTTSSSVSSPVDTTPDSSPVDTTPKPRRRGEPFRPTTTHTVHSFNRVLDEISSSLYTLHSLTPGVEPEPCESRPPNSALSSTVRQTTTNGSWITPRTAKSEDNPLTYPTPNASSQRTADSTDSREQFRELWYGSILDGCWSSTRLDLNAARVVSYGFWADKSTPNLLAKMLMLQYVRLFTDPWVFNTGTLRIIKFLQEIEEQLKRERGVLEFLDFRASVRQSALDAFHISIDLVSVFPCCITARS